MTEQTGYGHGAFCWHEIATRDAEAAKEFYAGVVGWNVVDTPMPGDQGGTYTMLKAGEGDIAGLWEMQGEQFEGIPAHWMSYVWVDDVEAAASKAESLGGKIMSPPMEIPDIGRMAVIQDPTGAMFAVFNGTGHPGAAQIGPGPGAVGWNELATRDTEAAGKFYGELFGWSVQTEDMPTGPYMLFKRGEEQAGGMMNMEGEKWEGIPSHWMNYVNVADCDACLAKVADLGGEIKVPAMDIPNVGRFAVVSDPSGAVFSPIKFTDM